MKYQLCLCTLITALAACDATQLTSVSTTDASDSTDDLDTGVNPTEDVDTGATDQDGTNPMLLVGLVKMEPNSTESDFSRALFGKLDSTLTADYIIDSFAPTADRCRVTTEEFGDNNFEPTLSVFDHTTTLISAGENVIVNNDGGTYATLDRVDSAVGPHYQTDVRQPDIAPIGLSVDILGDVFPSFPNISIDDVPALVMTTPFAELEASTVMQWIPNTLNWSVIEMYAGGVGGPNNENLSLDCTLIDDGSYEFPNAIQEELGDFIADWTSFIRISYSFEQKDDAIIAIANSVKADALGNN